MSALRFGAGQTSYRSWLARYARGERRVFGARRHDLMMDVNALIQFIETARDRVRSIEATLIDRRRLSLLKRAFDFYGASTGFPSGGGHFLTPRGGESDDTLDETVWEIKLWAERTRFRQERTGPNMEAILVVDGTHWWDWSSADGLQTDADDPGVEYRGGFELLDAGSFIRDSKVEVLGEALVAGRTTWRLVIVRDTDPRSVRPWEPGVDRAELLVDQATGVALRIAQLFEGQEVAVLQVEEVAFDRELPAELFTFTRPPSNPS